MFIHFKQKLTKNISTTTVFEKIRSELKIQEINHGLEKKQLN